MTPFTILGLGDFISSEGTEVIIRSFSNFYHGLTTKHQKKISLCIVDEYKYADNVNRLLKENEIEHCTSLITITNQERLEDIYQKSSFFFLPSNGNLKNIVQESLSYGLPILSYENNYYEDILDQTCSMLIPYEDGSDSVLEFSRILCMLYNDMEATRILQRGAKRRYQDRFTWKENRRARVSA